MEAGVIPRGNKMMQDFGVIQYVNRNEFHSSGIGAVLSIVLLQLMNRRMLY